MSEYINPSWQDVAERWKAYAEELEAQKRDLIDNLRRSGGSYYEMQQQYGVIFTENCELQGRITELESKLSDTLEEMAFANKHMKIK